MAKHGQRSSCKAQTDGASSIVGVSPQAVQLRRDIARVAPHRANVLISGPTGTGKELVARELHEQSVRHANLFIPVDCTLLTGELMATQLFGHVRGAFTGANSETLGCFRAADGGTLFLDELGEMPLDLQAKLLRVIQERAVVPVGSHTPAPIDVRVVAATNRDLAEETRVGRFREDLFFRLNVVQLRTTALAERREDIPVLARHFLRQFSVEGHPYMCLTPGAIEALATYPWPGNVRQLRNVMEQAAIESTEPMISQRHIERLLASTHYWCNPVRDLPPSPAPRDAILADEEKCTEAPWKTLDDVERRHLIATLEHTYYNRSVAARLLGISRQALLRRMEKHHIGVPRLPGKTS